MIRKMRIILLRVTPIKILIYHWLLSVAGGWMLAVAELVASATAATPGRVRPVVVLAMPTASPSVLFTSSRQMAPIVTSVSPSAASTQIVPNGGKEA